MMGEDLRGQIVETTAALNTAGLSRGSSGNVSARIGHRGTSGYLITPSGIPNEQITTAEVLTLRLDEIPRVDVRPRASSEWRFHRDIYAARPEVNAVVHTHPPFATTLACLRRDIPAFHYMVAVSGGHDIRCAGYATFGTQELSDRVLAALEGRRTCLLANHGMVAVGATLVEALALAVEVEALAEMYWRTLQVGPPVLLDEGEMDRVLERFSAYRG
jgi:L-fuculose-phosphate aldolase